MKEVTIDGHKYKVGRLDAFRQLHVVRRLAPMFGQVAPLLRAHLDPKDPMAALHLLIEPLSDVVAKLPDTDVEYVINTCLGVVERQSGAGWARVYVPGGGLAFQDLDMSSMLKLVWAVLEANLASFFSAAPSISTGAPPSKG